MQEKGYNRTLYAVESFWRIKGRARFMFDERLRTPYVNNLRGSIRFTDPPSQFLGNPEKIDGLSTRARTESALFTPETAPESTSQKRSRRSGSTSGVPRLYSKEQTQKLFEVFNKNDNPGDKILQELAQSLVSPFAKVKVRSISTGNSRVIFIR